MYVRPRSKIVQVDLTEAKQTAHQWYSIHLFTYTYVNVTYIQIIYVCKYVCTKLKYVHNHYYSR